MIVLFAPPPALCPLRALWRRRRAGPRLRLCSLAAVGKQRLPGALPQVQVLVVGVLLREQSGGGNQREGSEGTAERSSVAWHDPSAQRVPRAEAGSNRARPAAALPG